MARATLSILIPCYNESAAIDQTLDAVAAVARGLQARGVDVEVVAVDDGSIDGTYEKLVRRRGRDGFALVPVRHERNRGKGGAIKTGREHCSGDLVVMQDADLELDPAEIPSVIGPILDGRADAVLGSRFLRTGERLVVNFWHRLGNKVLTYASNAFTGLDITDMETGFKAFSISTFRLMHLTKERFGIEPEMVARLAQMRARVVEVPVSYRGRTYTEGKKITWKDGVAAFGHILSAHRSAGQQLRLTTLSAHELVRENTGARTVQLAGETVQTEAEPVTSTPLPDRARSAIEPAQVM